MSKSAEPIARKSIGLSREEWEEIDAYRQSERLVTLAEAVRKLLRVALRAEARKAKR